VQDLAGERGDLALKTLEELRHQLIYGLRLEGTSKNLERMAHAAIVRSDEALRKEDTETKYPTEEQRSMTEGEQVYTALELAMNAAGARFFEVPFRPSSYFSNRLTSVVTMEYVDLRSATISSSCKAGHARRSGGYGEMFQRSRKEKEGWRWVMNFMVTTLTLAIDQLDGRDAIAVGLLLCFLREATGGVAPRLLSV
jgi:hypothetical protein